MIIASNLITPKGFKGIAIWPFIFVASKDIKKDKILINHERIHLRQQIELLIIPFYIWYGIEYLLKGYEGISFEKEAKENSRNMDYLKGRKLFNFKNYI